MEYLTLRDSIPALLLLALCLSWVGSSPVLARVVPGEEKEEVEEDEAWDETDHDMDGYVQWPILCPNNNWYSKERDSCMPCSQCLADQYITRPCYRFQDTACASIHQYDLTAQTDSVVSPDQSGQTVSRWRPLALALEVITAVLATALLVASLAFCFVWRRQRMAVDTGEKLVSSVSSLHLPVVEVEKKVVGSYSAVPTSVV